MIHIHGGASAEEQRDYLERDQFTESHRAECRAASGDGSGRRRWQAFDAIELYSCFPVVPKMARRTLGLGDDVMPTVTGGLTFFGAPLNTYMTHAACAMVRKLRDGAKLGLLYGQGGFVTKHHALVLSRGRAEARCRRTPACRRRRMPRAARCRNSSTEAVRPRQGRSFHGAVRREWRDRARRRDAADRNDQRTLARVPAR